MNRSSAIAVVSLSCWLCAENLRAVSPEIVNARQHGAQGQVTLRVTDSTGKPIEKAQLSVAFWASDSSADVVVSEGTTDTNGLFVAAGKTIHSMNYEIKKDDSYKTTGQYWFYPGQGRSVLNGRWQPWNPTNTVVLKEKRNPVAMYAKNVETPLPLRDTAVGFDLEVGDWVAPHGKGREADMFFTYTARVQDYWTFSNQLFIACSNQMAGLYRTTRDTGTSFPSIYEAPTNGYQAQVVQSLDRTKYKIMAKEEIGGSEYLVFRVRTVLDDKGNILSARYGKIYGPIEYGEKDQGGGGVRFTYYLNPTDNDRNLEFNPSRNLFNWRHDARERPYMP